MKENLNQIKSFQFSVDIIKLYKKMIEQHECIISKQILRSGTSIGANIEEGIAGQSKKIFGRRFLSFSKKPEKLNID